MSLSILLWWPLQTREKRTRHLAASPKDVPHFKGEETTTDPIKNYFFVEKTFKCLNKRKDVKDLNLKIVCILQTSRLSSNIQKGQ